MVLVAGGTMRVAEETFKFANEMDSEMTDFVRHSFQLRINSY